MCLHEQVFVALLRTCQADSRRVLVRQALDTLTPALVRRLAPGDLKYPIWVRYTKKVLVEEGHSMPHLYHIWQLIVRHADLFYTARSGWHPKTTPAVKCRGRKITESPAWQSS
jgi:transformation/transcription domain-associated protein